VTRTGESSNFLEDFEEIQMQRFKLQNDKQKSQRQPKSLFIPPIQRSFAPRNKEFY